MLDYLSDLQTQFSMPKLDKATSPASCSVSSCESDVTSGPSTTNDSITGLWIELPPIGLYSVVFSTHASEPSNLNLFAWPRPIFPLTGPALASLFTPVLPISRLIDTFDLIADDDAPFAGIVQVDASKETQLATCVEELMNAGIHCAGEQTQNESIICHISTVIPAVMSGSGCWTQSTAVDAFIMILSEAVRVRVVTIPLAIEPYAQFHLLAIKVLILLKKVH